MDPVFFGQFLLARKRVTSKELARATELQHRTNLRLGALAIQQRLLSEGQVTTLNNLQRSVDRQFGQLAVSEGYLTATQLEQLLEQQRSMHIKLGQALLQIGALTETELAAELEAFNAAPAETLPAQATVFQGRDRSDLLDTIADLANKIFLRIGHQFVKIGQRSDAAVAFPPAGFAVHQRISGADDFVVGLSLPLDLALCIATELLGEPVTEPDELAHDSCAEFLNIITGHLCAKLGNGHELHPPVMHGPSTDPLDMSALIANRRLATTSLLHPDGTAQLFVVFG